MSEQGKKAGCTRLADCTSMTHWSGCLTNPGLKLYTQAQMDTALTAARAKTWEAAIEVVRDAGKLLASSEEFNECRGLLVAVIKMLKAAKDESK